MKFSIYKLFLASVFVLFGGRVIGQINKELENNNLQKISTKNHTKSIGLDIDISYPSDWEKTEGKRPHILFNISNSDKSIRSSFLIKDILESATMEEKKLFKSVTASEVEKVLLSNFPNSSNCESYFIESGYENVTKPKCRITKIEGLGTSVAFAFGSLQRAEFTFNQYTNVYQILHKTKIIAVTFNFQNVKSDEDRNLADILVSKIMNTVIVNNLWK